ncbi:MAG: V-type ATP synthase subunit I [Candidatus Rhabdochlamydia sp.]
MIIPMKKYLILGVREDSKNFFKKAQQQGVLEFIPGKNKISSAVPKEMQCFIDAIRILRKLNPVDKSKNTEQSAEEIALHIIHLKKEIELLSEQIRMIRLEIARVSPLGDFSKEDIAYIEEQAKKVIQFFCMKTLKRAENPPDEGLIYLSTEYDLDYFMAIHTASVNYPHMIEMRVDKPVGILKEELEETKQSLQKIERELKESAYFQPFLQEALIIHLNTYHLEQAKSTVQYPLENSIFCVEAWIPQNKVRVLYSLVNDMAIHCESIAIEEGEVVPTYMQNKGVARIGEDLVRVYDIPAHTDKDPSTWVFWFFVLFFSMIVADGGYGLLYLALSGFCWFKFPNLKGQKRRFLKLATILATGCVVWGVCTASFFGLELKPSNWLMRVSPLQTLVVKKADYHLQKNDDVQQELDGKFPQIRSAVTGQEVVEKGVEYKDGKASYAVSDNFSRNILLDFSILLGILHISCSLMRYLFRNWAGIGWVLFMIGGYLYFPSILNTTTILHFLHIVGKVQGAEIGLQLLFSGIIISVALALIQHRLKGLKHLTQLLEVFADVLSYLRLYALALAGTIMASTFNQLGKSAGLFGFIPILGGHSINILLGLMAGVIHGLRLNFIEWYHYCFDGGGRLFKPLTYLKSKKN